MHSVNKNVFRLENNVPSLTEDVMEDDENDIPVPVDNDSTSEEINPTKVQQSSTRQRPPKGVDKLIDYMNNKKKTTTTRPAPDDIDMFFGSASLSVKKLPRRLQNRIKREVLDSISWAEEENESLMTHVLPIIVGEPLATPFCSPLHSGSSSSSSAGGFIPTINNVTSLSQTGTLLRVVTDSHNNNFDDNYSKNTFM